MGLFQTSVQKQYLAAQDSVQIEKMYKKFTQFFHDPQHQQNINNSKEVQFQEGFLNELFVKVLGYTLNPAKNFNLKTEFKNLTNSKKADGAILIDGEAIGIIELKSVKTRNLEDVKEQAFGYKVHHPKCNYVITSNFANIRFYINDATEFLEFNLFELTKEDFALLWLCLSCDNILSDLPNRIKKESIHKDDEITKLLYNDYSVFKRSLYDNLVKRNMRNTVFRDILAAEESERAEKSIKRVLFKKSQKLIDRFLFIFFAEDSKDLLPSNCTMEVLGQWEQLKQIDEPKPLYDLFKKFFNYLDTGREANGLIRPIFAYNGGLFKPDPLLDSLLIDDDLLNVHIRKLSSYDFQSEVSVNILGHIFENSLNEIESVNADIDGTTFDKQTTKRKKDGVFYTPRYITKYIVNSTIGRLCNEEKRKIGIIDDEYYKDRKKRVKETIDKLQEQLNNYRSWLLNLTILDPACGSGAFLNEAVDFLIAEHEYVDKLEAKLYNRINAPQMELKTIANTILEKNIFGVDINDESVEIAKLSMWLKTAKKGIKLNSLNNNIKCGNSLIETKAVAGEKAFKWQKEFPEIFANGGFDVVIGNPPWGAKVPESQKDYILSKYVCNTGEIETYAHFIDLGMNNILKNEGYLGMITPSTWYYLDKYYKLRKALLSYEIVVLIELEKRIFEDAPDMVPAIFVVRKNDQIENKTITTFKLKAGVSTNYLIESGKFYENQISPQNWQKFETLAFNLQMTSNITNVLTKIQKESIALSSWYNVRYGIKTGNNSKFVKKNSEITDKSKNWKDCIASARAVKKYSLIWESDKIDFGVHLSGYSVNSFERPKILIQYIRKISMDTRLVCSLDNTGQYYPLNNFSFVEAKNNGLSLAFLLAILNSKLMNFYFKHVHIDYNIKPKYIEKLPLKEPTQDQIIPLENLTNKMTELNKSLSVEREMFFKRIRANLSLENITQKLETFYLYDFKTLLGELKKQKIVLSLVQQDPWEVHFDLYKDKIRIIIEEIERLDNEIDEMVYKLYGLTAEERQIVLDSSK